MMPEAGQTLDEKKNMALLNFQAMTDMHDVEFAITILADNNWDEMVGKFLNF